MRALAISILILGCGDSSNSVNQNQNAELVCSSFPGRTCIAWRIDPDNQIGNCPNDVNTLHVTSTSFALDSWTPKMAPLQGGNLCFPVMFAVLPPAGFSGHFHLDALGTDNSGKITADASTENDIQQGEHRLTQSSISRVGNNFCPGSTVRCNGSCCGSGELCCTDNAVQSCCSSTCGSSGQACCTGGDVNPCRFGLCCDQSSKQCVDQFQMCGTNQVCLPSASPPPTCQTCGGSGQICCNGNCALGLICDFGSNTCVSCGGENQKCCTSDLGVNGCVVSTSCQNTQDDMGKFVDLCTRCGWSGETCCGIGNCPNSDGGCVFNPMDMGIAANTCK
jgi:hypothetical protein